MTALDHILQIVRGRPVVALTGAGISTDSGIPDYRGPGTLARARKQVQFQEFARSRERRRHYWARSYAGWPRIEAARPNPAHHALAELEQRGDLVGIITQNVDGLHGKAGSRRVVELHGSLAQVRCLDCEVGTTRSRIQERLRTANPGWRTTSLGPAPDGDEDLDSGGSIEFEIADCMECGGRLKPDVVFFGENVPGPLVEQAWSLFGKAEALLVLGSSLAVYSGYRFVRKASQNGMPIVIINLGETRGDPLASQCWRAQLSDAVPELVRCLQIR